MAEASHQSVRTGRDPSLVPKQSRSLPGTRAEPAAPSAGTASAGSPHGEGQDTVEQGAGNVDGFCDGFLETQRSGRLVDLLRSSALRLLPLLRGPPVPGLQGRS